MHGVPGRIISRCAPRTKPMSASLLEAPRVNVIPSITPTSPALRFGKLHRAISTDLPSFRPGETNFQVKPKYGWSILIIHIAVDHLSSPLEEETGGEVARYTIMKSALENPSYRFPEAETMSQNHWSRACSSPTDPRRISEPCALRFHSINPFPSRENAIPRIGAMLATSHMNIAYHTGKANGDIRKLRQILR